MSLELVASLPEDPTEAWKLITDSFLTLVSEYRFQTSGLPLQGERVFRKENNYHERFLNFLSIIEVFIDIHYPGILDNSDCPKMSGTIDTDIEKIVDFFSSVARPRLSTAVYRDAMERKYGKQPQYQFLGEDLERVQVLINDLRNLLVQTNSLDSKHQERLLKRLEALQKELHKETADLDRFWGFVVDTSATLKVVGENAKPMVDRVQEIANIIWKIQARVHGLPEDSPSLPPVESSLELPEANDD